MLKQEALLSFPDFTKPFHLYTDASDRQFGATVVQDEKHVAGKSNVTIQKTTFRYWSREHQKMQAREIANENNNQDGLGEKSMNIVDR